MQAHPIVPIVMAGGAGTRLWPLSRAVMPKQFLALLEGGLSTFQSTLLRVKAPHFAPPIIITHHEFRFMAAEQMRQVGVSGDIVLEPERRDSAAATAVGALLAMARAKHTIGMALTSDHAVNDVAAFQDDCAIAATLAAEGRIMTLGSAPTYPATGYGYIEPGASLGAARAYALKRFVEKPDAATATVYCEQGLLWNSGNFIFCISTMLNEFETLAPEVLAGVRAALHAARIDLDFLQLDAGAFTQVPRISIDHAVMERTRHAGVLAARFDWSDVGTWNAVHALKTQDPDGNVLQGNVVALDSRRCLIRSDEVLTAVIGLDDAVVVTMRDAVLVASQAAAGQVKTLVEILKQRDHREADTHSRIHRPWGWYQRLDSGARFQVTRIRVKPGHTVDLREHLYRGGHWIVVSGTADVMRSGTLERIHQDESMHVAADSVHSLVNSCRTDLEVIAVQVGGDPGDDSVVRLEDGFA